MLSPYDFYRYGLDLNRCVGASEAGHPVKKVGTLQYPKVPVGIISVERSGEIIAGIDHIDHVAFARFLSQKSVLFLNPLLGGEELIILHGVDAERGDRFLREGKKSANVTLLVAEIDGDEAVLRTLEIQGEPGVIKETVLRQSRTRKGDEGFQIKRERLQGTGFTLHLNGKNCLPLRTDRLDELGILDIREPLPLDEGCARLPERY
jgi:hypothetical protein